MNKIYRAIWNETTQTWVAASELAKSKTKSDTVSSLPATSQTSSKRRFATIFKLSLVASFLNLSLLAPNVYASNAALIGGSNMGDNSPTQSYKDKNGNVFASHGSIILNGANDFVANGTPNNPISCGADEVTGRGDPGRTISGTSITALEEYLRFAEDRSYGGKNPYGTTTSSVDARQAAMQGELTGGAISKMPVAYGVYSFASGCGSYTSGNYSMAFGTNATATAGGAMAIGTAALAAGRASIAFGVGAEATGVSSVALGSVASSNGVGSVAAGLMSQASADGTVALGVQAEAKNNSAVAIGNSAQATGEQSISIGSANQVSGKGSGAIGGSNATTQYDTVNGKQTTAASGVTIVTGDGSYSFGNQNGTIAANNTGVFGNRNTIQTDSEGVNKADNIRILGNNNTVTAQAGGAMIVGNAANVSAANGLALGNNTSVSGANGVAIGAGAIAEDENGVALGSGSVASGNVVAIGNASAGITRQITGLAAGTLDTDAVNVAQLKSLDASTSTSISSLSSSTSTSLSALEDNFTNLSTSTSSSILEATKELKSISTSVDGHISSTGATLTELQTSASTSILELRDNALQWNNEVQAYDAAHLASGAKTAKIINVQAGDITTKDSTDAVNGGQLYTTNSNLSSLSLSVSSSINELSDKLVSSNTTDIISLSTMASSIGDTVGKLQKDALQWKDGSYSADHGTDEAQVITNVAAGNTTPNSTDAINGSQLYSLSTATQSGLETVASSLSSLSVSTATGLNSLSSSINSSLSNATEGVTELKQNALQWNNNIGAYDAARNGNIQKITNVAAGTVGENSTDAVNAGQLFSLSNSTSTGLSSLSSSLSTITENQMGDMSGTVSRLNENVSSLSTGLSTIDGSVTALQQNALQWNSNIGAYDATRGGSTQKLSGIKEGYIAADSTDAINGSQLHSLSTVTQLGLDDAASGLSSLSVSTATGLNSLSSSINSSLSNATEGVTELKQNALQWNNNIGAYDAARNGNIQKITNVAAGTVGENSTDAVNAGQLFSLSNSTSTGLSSLSSSLSTITENQMGDMSGTVSRLNENVSSLSTGLSTIDGSVTALQQNALQWNSNIGAYDATRGGSTQKLSGIKEGYIAADSTDAINGSQLHSLSTVTQLGLDDAASGLSSLSVSTATGLNSLSSSINSSLSNATEGVTELKQNALQWNNNIGAYDAARNGNIQKITNVAAGTVGENSTDAVNAGQLFSLSNSTSTGLSSLSSSLSTITENQMGDMSGTVSRLNENVSSLSTGLSTIDGSVTALQQNALQWNSNIGAYDATRGGSTQKLSGIKEGYIAADSTDAINGSQLHSLSTVTQLGLDDAASGLSSLSVSTATGLNSLSSSINSSLSNATEGVTELKQNALQWNNNIGAYDAARNGNIQKITNVAAGTVGENSTDAVNAGQLFSLSNSTSTGLSSLSSSLSTITENQMGDMSGTVSRLNENVSSLSTGLSTIDGSVTALQQNALQWNSNIGAYDATRGGSTQKLSGIKEGYIAADSTDAINGSQLHSLSTVTQLGLDDAASGLSSLSVSTATGLNSLSSSINSSLSNATEGVTELKQNALQWNNNIGAYDAARNGNIQKITNVAAGTVGENSTDAVNAGQLFSLSNSTSTGLSSLSSSLSTITENQMGDMSGTVSRLNENVSSLSTGLSTIDGSVTALQQNALQWNGQVYDATRDGSTQTLTGITAGRVEADSTDAINGSQLHSLSTVTQSGLSTATSGLNSLSLSTATGLNSLSSSMNSVNQSLTTLQQDALQWNSNIGAYDAARNGNIQKITNVAAGTLGENSTDAVNAGQLFSLSNSTSTGLSSLSTAVSDIGSISVSMSTGYNELLSSLSTTQDQLGQLETSTNNKLTSLDTNYQNIRNDVDKLRENSLKWNNDLGNGEGGFDASRPNSLTRAPSYGKIVNLADGSLEPDSHEAVNGGQLRIVKDDLLSLSSSTSTGLSSLASMMANTSTNALQWNSNIGAYDATHNGTAQRITNVAAGTLGENSTDAINGHQLWEVRNDLNSLSTTVNNLPTGGDISQGALDSLSTSISASVASQIASMSEALGGTKQSNSDGSNQPSYNISLASDNGFNKPNYDIYAPNGDRETVHDVGSALQAIQKNGTKYESINSMKTQAKATGMESIAIGGDAMASGASAIAIGDSASAPESNSVAMGQGAKSQKAGGVALGAGSVADRAGNRRKGNVYIPETATDSQAKAILATESDEYGAVSVGNAKEGQYRQITGVAAGTEDSDAVNVAQLKGVNNQIGNINKYVNKINERVQRTERRAYSGTALAMALSGAYLPSLNAGEQAVGVGVGTYRGYTAVGANYKAISNSGNVGWGAGVSTTGKEVGFNAGVGFKWGGN